MDISRKADIMEEIALIEKNGSLGIQEQKRSGRHENSSIERGTYVPDDAHIDICLNCTRKKCTTGNCKLMSKNTRKRG